MILDVLILLGLLYLVVLWLGSRLARLRGRHQGTDQ